MTTGPRRHMCNSTSVTYIRCEAMPWVLGQLFSGLRNRNAASIRLPNNLNEGHLHVHTMARRRVRQGGRSRGGDQRAG